MPMPLVDPNFMRNQQLYLNLKAMQNAAETKGNPSQYVLYKKQHYALSDALCFVLFKEKLYAVIEADPVRLSDVPKPFKKTGTVFLNRKGENDLSDMPEENTEKTYPVYRRRFPRRFLTETPIHEGTLYPMLEIRKGLIN